MMDGPAELVLKVRCDGRYCSKCRFLRRRWIGYYAGQAKCIIFGRLKIEKWRDGRNRAVRAEKCLDAGNVAWVLRQIATGKMKPVRASDLLKSGKLLAPYIPLRVSKLPVPKKRR